MGKANKKVEGEAVLQTGREEVLILFYYLGCLLCGVKASAAYLKLSHVLDLM